MTADFWAALCYTAIAATAMQPGHQTPNSNVSDQPDYQATRKTSKQQDGNPAMTATPRRLDTCTSSKCDPDNPSDYRANQNSNNQQYGTQVRDGVCTSATCALQSTASKQAAQGPKVATKSDPNNPSDYRASQGSKNQQYGTHVRDGVLTSATCASQSTASKQAVEGPKVAICSLPKSNPENPRNHRGNSTGQCATQVADSIPKSATCISQPAVPNQTVEGLEDVIVSLSLQEHAAEICHWCFDMGAVYLAEVAEEAENLCNSTDLNGFERDRVLAWAAEVIGAAVAPASHPDVPILSQTLSQLPNMQTLVRTDGPSSSPKRKLWADLMKLEGTHYCGPAKQRVNQGDQASSDISVVEEGKEGKHGPSMAKKKISWADLVEFEAPELEDGKTGFVVPAAVGREKSVQWMYPLVTVIEFLPDEDPDHAEDGPTVAENLAKTQQTQSNPSVTENTHIAVVEVHQKLQAEQNKKQGLETCDEKESKFSDEQRRAKGRNPRLSCSGTRRSRSRARLHC